MNEEQFDEFVDHCYKEFEMKQNQLIEAYNLGHYSEYWYDQTTKILQFKERDLIALEFDIICIGSWAHKNETWLWSWANQSVTDECRKDSERIKGLKTFTGVEVFEMEGLKCDEVTAYELVAMSIHHLDAIGMYRIPGEKSHLFVAIMKEKATCIPME